MDMTTKTKSHRLFVPQSMIPALLSGAKTQHRIPLKRQPPDGETLQVGIYHPTRVRKDGEEYPGPATFGCFTPDGDWALPYPYQPGDELWVAETWMPHRWHHNKFITCVGVRYQNGGVREDERAGKLWTMKDARRWRSPVTMPRWAARIVRTVKAVRVEREGDGWFWVLDLEAKR